MAYSTPLKYCLDLSQVNGGCPYWLRNWCTKGITRHRPECQVRRDSERIGFFDLREDWIGEAEEKQLWNISRKKARCYGCRTNFIVIWEKYAHKFNWPSIVDGRYAESFFNSYHYLLIEEFKLADEEYNKAISAAATNGAINRPPAEELTDATDSEVPRVGPQPSAAKKRDVEARFDYLFAESPEYNYTLEEVDSDISLS